MEKEKRKKKKEEYKKMLCIVLIIIAVTGFVIVSNKQKRIETKPKEIVQVSIDEKHSNQNEEEKLTIDSSVTDWDLMLVNKDNKIPEDYKLNLQMIEDGYKVDSRITQYITHMLKDMRKEGLDPFICSSYRSYKKQEGLFKNKVEKYKKQGYSKEKAEEEASLWISIPRTSEHETGLALDIVARSYQLLDEKQETMPEQQWLMKNCYKYGFVLRYKKDKQEITKVNQEPWHYRYVGEKNALFMQEKNFCLEEYIDYLKGE